MYLVFQRMKTHNNSFLQLKIPIKNISFFPIFCILIRGPVLKFLEFGKEKTAAFIEIFTKI